MLAAKYIVIAVAGLGVLTTVALRSSGRVNPSVSPASPSSKGNGSYLTQAQLPDSLALLPPPPAAGSAAMEQDEAARQRALALAGTPRYAVAKADAARGFQDTLDAFSCPLGATISKDGTPGLYNLLVRMRIDTRRASYRAKNHYKRVQPFVLHHTKTCSASEEELVRAEGAYPSARSAVGWAYALVLAELNPARSSEIMQRGRQFEESRVICDVQWQSDVEAGQRVGAATLAQLRRNAAFNADLGIAQKEVAHAIATGRGPPAMCRAQAAALASARLR